MKGETHPKQPYKVQETLHFRYLKFLVKDHTIQHLGEFDDMFPPGPFCGGKHFPWQGVIRRKNGMHFGESLIPKSKRNIGHVFFRGV